MSKKVTDPPSAGDEGGPAVDFGIITALPVERDAVRRRLEGCKETTYGGDPHTYYEGHVSIPGTGDAYRAVLVMQLGMGNPEASTAATTFIERWHPVQVAMVGIAGGVRGKVDVGDVVVGELSYYYEPGKQTAHGEQRRSKQFPSGRLLLGRAKAYDAADWHHDLREARPTAGASGTQPSVHFGPIAAGEQVVATDRFLRGLQRGCPQLLAVAMEGAGVALAASNSATPWLEIRGISDYADETKGDDGWRRYAADAAAAFLVGLLRTRPVALAVASQEPQAVGRPLLVLCAQSLRTIGSEEISPALTPDLRNRPREFVSLDLTDLVEGRVVIDPETAARRLTDPAGALMTALARRAEADVAFQGLCHIPFAMLAGHLASDRQPVALYDFHPTVSSTWTWPDVGSEAFPELLTSGMDSVPEDADEILLAVSTSYEANVKAVRATAALNTPLVSLSVMAPERGIIRSARQTLAYGLVFRRVLDRISARVPACRRIHVFFAGPMAFAFHMGQLVSENIHPPVVAWNYRQTAGYEWGLDLAAARLERPSIIRAPSAPYAPPL